VHPVFFRKPFRRNVKLLRGLCSRPVTPAQQLYASRRLKATTFDPGDGGRWYDPFFTFGERDKPNAEAGK
jgi:hypothetical protein